jgi:hypothetical protein
MQLIVRLLVIVVLLVVFCTAGAFGLSVIARIFMPH